MEFVLAEPYKKLQFPYAVGFAAEEVTTHLAAALLQLLRTGRCSHKIELLKKSRHRQLFKLTVDQQVYFVKIYQRRGVVNALKNRFRPADGIRALKKACLLYSKGIPAVKAPVALVERGYIFQPKSLAATCQHAGISLRRFFIQEKSVKMRHAVLERFARLFVDLLENKIYHGDASLDNFLVAQGRIILVDFDGIKRFPLMPRKLILANLARLNRVLIRQSRFNSPLNLGQSEREFVLEAVIKRFFPPAEAKDALQTVKRLTRR